MRATPEWKCYNLTDIKSFLSSAEDPVIIRTTIWCCFYIFNLLALVSIHIPQYKSGFFQCSLCNVTMQCSGNLHTFFFFFFFSLLSHDDLRLVKEMSSSRRVEHFSWLQGLQKHPWLEVAFALANGNGGWTTTCYWCHGVLGWILTAPSGSVWNYTMHMSPISMQIFWKKCEFELHCSQVRDIVRDSVDFIHTVFVLG